MHKIIGFCITLTTLAFLGVSHAEFHTFTDKEGRTMKAKIEGVQGDTVKIQREDGLSTNVAISIFSAKDQANIAEWEKAELLKRGAFTVKAATRSSGKGSFKQCSKGVLEKKWTAGYDVELTNSTTSTLEGIRLEYMIFKFEDELAADTYKDGKNMQIKGTAKVGTLKPRAEYKFATNDLPMRETKLERGYYWTKGGHKKSRDKLGGIWIRIYVGDDLLQEWSMPERIKDDKKWK